MNTTNFMIFGISDYPVLELPIFLMVLMMYLLSLGANLIIFLLVCLDPHLHTPMYFFLNNLSVLDICSSTVILHKILISFISNDNTISGTGCIAQITMYVCLTCSELLILTVMSYDRYVAICNPLHYHQIMNSKVCAVLAVTSWVCGFIEGIPILPELLKIKCFSSNRINHFYCDIVPFIKLSCDNTLVLQLYILIEGSFVTVFLPFSLTFISYVFIVSTILRIPSSAGRLKSFYTCYSHLTVVFLLYASLVFQYLRPNSMVNLNSTKFTSLFNTAAVPVLNPLIYSLRNKDVKAAMRRTWKCMVVPHKNVV